MRKVVVAALVAMLGLGLAGCAGGAQGAGGDEAPDQAGAAAPEAASPEDEAHARQLVDAMLEQEVDNLTLRSTVTTRAKAGSITQESVIELEVLYDATGAEPRLSYRMSSPQAPSANSALYLVGATAVTEDADGARAVVSVDPAYAAELLGSLSMGNDQSRALADALDGLTLSQEDGLTFVSGAADPAKVAAAVDGLEEVTSCEASYAFDGEGRLVEQRYVVCGRDVTEHASADVTITTETTYSDYGSTVAPDLPAVSDPAA